MLAGETAGPVLAVRVRRDRQLGMVAWVEGVEIICYNSYPTLDHGTESDVADAPVGAEDAPALAAAFGHPHRGEDLVDLLEEELDDESADESERLRDALRLLRLPEWIVASGGLPAIPRPVSLAPRSRAITSGAPQSMRGWRMPSSGRSASVRPRC